MTLLQRFMQEEDALGTVELILIIVVLVGLVAIFKKQLVLSLIHISEPTRPHSISRMPSSA